MSKLEVSPFPRYQLAELAAPGPDAFVDGPFGSSLKSDEYVDAGVRLIQLQNIGEGEWRDENQKFITPRKFRTLERHGAISGDIAIAKMADPVARACLVPPVADQFVVVADCIRLRLDEFRFDPGFVVRSINSPYTRREAEQKAIGSTRVRINLSVLKTVGCLAPDLPEQQAITKVLDTLDTAIRETEALIDKLKAVKQGLLHDLLTRGIDVNGQLRPPQSEAPQLYKESPLGWIPREWEVQSIAALLTDIEAGKSPSCPDTPASSGSWGVLKVSAVHPDGFRSDQNKLVEHESLVNPAYEVHSGDLLITRANTPELVGMACLVEDPQPKLMLCDKTLRLLVNDGIASKEYLFLCLQQPYIRSQIESSATGTSMSMKNISQAAIRNLLVAVAPLQEQIEISVRANVLALKLRQEMAVLEKLRQQKSGLMDDLLTGRVRVTPLLESVQQVAAQTEA